MTDRLCPVCNGADYEEIHRHEFVLFEGHPLAGTCEIAICQRCGMAFNRQAKAAEIYDAYYAEFSKYAAASSHSANAEIFAPFCETLQRLRPDKNISILDIGCGGGGFLTGLRSRGYRRLAALDPSPACIEYVRHDLGMEAEVGTLASPPFEDGRFDLIIATGLIEHLVIPAAALLGIKKLLAPGGVAFISVPDAARYAEFLEAPFQDFNIEHINHFHPAALETLFRLQGWHRLALEGTTIPCSPRWTEPTVYGLFTPNGSAPPPGEIQFDSTLSASLKSYVELSSALLHRIDQNLRRELAGVDEVLLWGGGQTSSLLLSGTVLKETKLRAVVDNNPAYAGRRLAGAPVGGPELKGDFRGPVVVGTIRSFDAVSRIIRETLGWDNRIISLL